MTHIAAFALWLTEFSFSALAALWIMPTRSRFRTVFRFLVFRVAADLASFVTLIFFGWNVYSFVLWLGRSGEYLLLSYVAAEICSKFVNETNRAKVSRYSAVFALVVGAALTLVFHSGETLSDKFLDTTIAANMFLAVAIAIAWLPAENKLPRKWRGITTGLLIYLGSEAVLTILWKSWPPAAHLFPLGHIAAFITWCAVFKPKAAVEFGTKQQQITRLEKMYGT